jgi:hypothetical protein
MGKKKKAVQATINYYPLLKRPQSAIGKFTSTPGKWWRGCPAADKEKRFKCIVVEFVACHDFGDSIKGAGFKCKEMGEDGKGSLEPGVASGSEFVMAYPNPFLEYFWYENRLELEPAIRVKLFPQMNDVAGGSELPVAIAGDGATDGAAADANADEQKLVVKEEKQKRPLIFDHLDLVSSTLNVSGSQRGKFTVKYACAVMLPNGKCGGSVTCYKTGDGKAETTSNAWTHLCDKAARCPIHRDVLASLEAKNPKAVQLENGEYVRVMSFEEAFPHHVDYVW